MFSKTIVVGHLGRDPELRFTPSGQQVCSFSSAGHQPQFRQSKWPAAGEDHLVPRDRLGQTGRLCHQYLSKGRLVLVEGEVDASAWTGKTGEPRASLEITTRNVRFLGGRDSAGGPMTARPSSPMEAPAMDEEDIPSKEQLAAGFGK